MYYFPNRYYDADIGIWTSTDPAQEFWSGYSYSSNPINSIDPDGLDSYILSDQVDFSSQAQTQANLLAEEFGTPVHIIDVQSNADYNNAIATINNAQAPVDGIVHMFHSKEGVMFANNNAFALSTTPSGVSPFSNTQCLSVMNLPNLGAKRIDLFTCNSAVTPIVGTTPGVIRPALSLLDAFKQTQGSTTVTGWHGKMSYLRGTGIPRLSNWQRYKVGRWYVHFKDIYGIAPKGRIVK